MKRKNIENGLALLGAVVVLIGVSSAATSAFAAQSTELESKAIAVHGAGAATLAAARKANSRSAAAAARSIARENLATLDIELADRTSTLSAGTD